MWQRNDGSLRALIELDKTSGLFKLDADGWTQFFPSDETRAELDSKIGNWIDGAIEAHQARIDEAARNLEAYKPVSQPIGPDGEKPILPSPTARTVANQVIASTTIETLRPRPMVAVDAYFNNEQRVIVPFDPEELRAAGVPIDPSVTEPVPVPITILSEDIAYNFELGLEFKLREKLDFANLFHRSVHACATGQSPIYIKVFAKRKHHAVIAPNVGAPIVDLSVGAEEEYDVDGEVVSIMLVPHDDVLVPNINQDVDELEWMAERNRDLRKPDDITRAYHEGRLPLIKDDEECQRFATARVTIATDETRARTDATTKKWTAPQEQFASDCPVFDVWFDAYLKVAPIEGSSSDAKPRIRCFSMVSTYHYAVRQSMAMYRNPYNHQRRILVPLQQSIDGGSTVGTARYAQELITACTHQEIKAATIANNPVYSYDPLGAPEVADYFKAHQGSPIRMGEFIPGRPGTDWGPVRAGFDRESMLGLMQWAEAGLQASAHSSDYTQGNRVVSHTSPQVVGAMLDRGGQNQKLFLQLLNRGWCKAFRLLLETWAQFQPMGDTIPVRNPVTKALMTVPFVYPVGEMLANFRFTLTAADDDAMRERDPDQSARDLELYHARAGFVANVVQAIRDPAATAEDSALLREVLAGENELYQRIVARTRSDVKRFDLMAYIDRILAAKAKAASEIPQGGLNAAPGQPAIEGGVAPEAAPPTDAAGVDGVGAEPGNAPVDVGTPVGGTSPAVPA